MKLSLLFSILLATLTACEPITRPANPPSVQGRYLLTLVNGNPLPAVIIDNGPAYRVTAFSETITLNADHTYIIDGMAQTAINDSTFPAVISDTGKYIADESVVELVPKFGLISVLHMADRNVLIEQTDADHTRVFVKQ